MCGVDDETEPRNAVCAGNHLRLRLMNSQTEMTQKIDDGALPFVEPVFAVAEEREIIDVPQISWASQVLRNEAIEGRQVDVAPELAGEIADGQAARAFDGEEIVAGKVDHLVFIGQHALAAADDPLDQPAGPLFLDRLEE